jgi:hypothetical protein
VSTWHRLQPRLALIYHQFSKENNRRCAEFQIAEGRILGRAERANGDASNLKQLHYSYLEFPTELCIALTNSSMINRERSPPNYLLDTSVTENYPPSITRDFQLLPQYPSIMPLPSDDKLIATAQEILQMFHQAFGPQPGFRPGK